MNKTEKGAWFGLILSGLLLAMQVVHMTLVSRMSRLISLSFVFSLILLLTIFFAMMQRRQEVDTDERDKFISKRALLAGFALVSGVLIFAVVVAYSVLGPSGSIPVCMLPPMLYGTFVIFLLVYSTAVLLQYGWGGRRWRKVR